MVDRHGGTGSAGREGCTLKSELTGQISQTPAQGHPDNSPDTEPLLLLLVSLEWLTRQRVYE